MKKILLSLVMLLCLCGCSCNKKTTEVTQVEIDLKGNPTTGYEWKCTVDNTNIAKMVSNNYVQDKNEEDLVGVGGTYKFIFEGVSDGFTTIACNYSRSFETEEPLYSLAYTVKIADKVISQYSKTGTYSEDTLPDAKVFETTK